MRRALIPLKLSGSGVPEEITTASRQNDESIAAPADTDTATLPMFLASRARDASDATLVAAFTVGFNVALSAIVWGGPGWILISAAAACFFAFGLWGIADRELHDGSERRSAAARGLRVARVMAGVIGALGFSTFFLVFLGVALGRLIS